MSESWTASVPWQPPFRALTTGSGPCRGRCLPSGCWTSRHLETLVPTRPTSAIPSSPSVRLVAYAACQVAGPGGRDCPHTKTHGRRHALPGWLWVLEPDNGRHLSSERRPPTRSSGLGSPGAGMDGSPQRLHLLARLDTQARRPAAPCEARGGERDLLPQHGGGVR